MTCERDRPLTGGEEDVRTYRRVWGVCEWRMHSVYRRHGIERGWYPLSVASYGCLYRCSLSDGTRAVSSTLRGIKEIIGSDRIEADGGRGCL